MRVVATSDLHGHWPDIPPCDLLVISGDITPSTMNDPHEQAVWMGTVLRPRLEALEARYVVVCGGNHDWVFLYDMHPKDLPWIYLQDETVEIEGLVIHGSPWSTRFGHWAFMADDHELDEHWQKIPENTDLLLVHGPPYGIGDRVLRTGQPHVGSWALRARIKRVRPQVVVCGHIHEGYGGYRTNDGDTYVLNASHCDVFMDPVNAPLVFDIEPRAKS